MFSQLHSGESKTQSRALAASLALHGLLFAWLLHTPEPQLLNPSSVALGRNGKLLTQIYFPTQSPDGSATSSPDRVTEVYRHQRLGHEKLILKQNVALAKLPLPRPLLSPSSAEDESKTATLSNLGHGSAGGASLRIFARRAGVRRRDSSGFTSRYGRSSGLSVGIAGLGRQRGGRDHD